MLIRAVVDDELRDYAQLSSLGLAHEGAKMLHRAEVWIDVLVVRNVVAIVTARRRIERQQPKGRNAEVLQVVELCGQADKIADAIAVAVGEGLKMKLIDDRVLEPQVVTFELCFGLDVGRDVHGAGLHVKQRNSRAGSCCGSIRKRTPPHSSRRRSPGLLGKPTSMSPKWNQNSRG